jgi:hypothetical protein
MPSIFILRILVLLLRGSKLSRFLKGAYNFILVDPEKVSIAAQCLRWSVPRVRTAHGRAQVDIGVEKIQIERFAKNCDGSPEETLRCKHVSLPSARYESDGPQPRILNASPTGVFYPRSAFVEFKLGWCALAFPLVVERGNAAFDEDDDGLRCVMTASASRDHWR